MLQEINMTKTILFGTMLAASMSMYAQENETAKFEVGADYTFTRVNPGGALGSYNSNGGTGFVEYNFNKVFGAVAELGGTYVGSANGVALNNTSFDYLFGPRFNLRRSRFTYYVQTLVGGERFTNGFNPGSASNPVTGASQSNFAAAIGGGVDIAVTNHIAIKPIQVEYLITQVSPGDSLHYVQNNLRYSAGVVFRLGSK
jgi:opacity protein-like surface antigen